MQCAAVNTCSSDIKLPPHLPNFEPLWAKTCTIHGFKPWYGTIPQTILLSYSLRLLFSLRLSFSLSLSFSLALDNEKTKSVTKHARIDASNAKMSKNILNRNFLSIVHSHQDYFLITGWSRFLKKASKFGSSDVKTKLLSTHRTHQSSTSSLHAQ